MKLQAEGVSVARSHGIRSTYRAGCRCDLCRQATADYQRAYYQRVGGNKNRKPEHRAARAARVKAAGGQRKLYPETYRAGDARRRARKVGAETESFKSIEVFDRDGWICGICELEVDASLRFPDSGSPSLDHIVPLSRGGSHTQANTQLAHLYCNMVKGDRETA